MRFSLGWKSYLFLVFVVVVAAFALNGRFPGLMGREKTEVQKMMDAHEDIPYKYLPQHQSKEGDSP